MAASEFSIDKIQKALDYFSQLESEAVGKDAITVDDAEMVLIAGKIASQLTQPEKRDIICREVEKIYPIETSVKSGVSSEYVADMCRNYGEGKRKFTRFDVMQAKRCCSAMLAYSKIQGEKK